MRPFEFVEPTTLDEVIGLLQSGTQRTRLIAGGSDLLGELKDDVVHYERLVSLAGITALQGLRDHAQSASRRLQNFRGVMNLVGGQLLYFRDGGKLLQGSFRQSLKLMQLHRLRRRWRRG